MSSGRPFLRWVGGKARVARRLSELLPRLDAKQRYYEPFLGAGSVYFRTAPNDAVLGDANASLISCFNWVREEPTLVARQLEALQTDVTRETYYLRRKEFNFVDDDEHRAALFIYLNRTCFNGIWRVNTRGEFNVPYGAKRDCGFPAESQLLQCATSLRRSTLRNCDFEELVADARDGDVVYFDPPYLPASDTAFFRHYTAIRFGLEDHERLAEAASTLTAKGVRVILTLSDSDTVRDLYGQLRLEEVEVRRYVGAGSGRKRVAELILTNY